VHAAVPREVLEKLRAICMAWPGVREEAAWVGTRWVVRKKNFAHVLMIADGWPPAYAKAAAPVLTDAGPACVLTFRSPLPQANAHAYTWAPFFRPPWFADIVGMRLEAASDWEEVASVLGASYRMFAPGTKPAAPAGGG